MSYKIWTVGELKDILTYLGKELDGDKTPVYSGDFEGNFTHGYHEVMLDSANRAIFLGYEMHESIDD